jgi:hypothetical protein
MNTFFQIIKDKSNTYQILLKKYIVYSHEDKFW